MCQAEGSVCSSWVFPLVLAYLLGAFLEVAYLVLHSEYKGYRYFSFLFFNILVFL